MAAVGFEQLQFSSSFVTQLPGDPELDNFRRQVSDACYSTVLPTPVAKPSLLISSDELTQELGLDPSVWQNRALIDCLGGNGLLPGMKPYAMCYGGHQFGHWAGQLGDGRAINLGEWQHQQQAFTWQLKGAGPTPYSRSADGLAVLRSSLREFLCSEAMHHLGVPTTRALSLVSTGNEVLRDMFYDGHPAMEPGAVVCRVAPSFVRFGNFELHAARGERALLKQLADYVIEHHYPELRALPENTRYIDWFEEVCRRTLQMIIHWQRVGFVHGVMNTDNMSIHGITIDYGPYGWLEEYDPSWTPNTTDREHHRYCYGNQPAIAQWNLWQLANALCAIVDESKALESILEGYRRQYEGEYHLMMAKKLGLQTLPDELLENLLSLMEETRPDYTLLFQALALYPKSEDAIKLLSPCFYADLNEEQKMAWRTWLAAYESAINNDSIDSSSRQQLMAQTNPIYVLRNYMAQLAIENAEQGKLELLHELYQLLKNPYTQQAGSERWIERRPEWANHKAGCSMLSCSS